MNYANQPTYLTNLAVYLIVVGPVFGCAVVGTMQAYPGLELPRDKVAIVEPRSVHTVISEIDEERAERAFGGFSQKRIAVLPGEHEIKAYQTISVGTKTIKSVMTTIAFQSEAGHTYQVVSGKVVAVYRSKDGTAETMMMWEDGATMIPGYTDGMRLVGATTEISILDTQTGKVVSQERSKDK